MLHIEAEVGRHLSEVGLLVPDSCFHLYCVPFLDSKILAALLPGISLYINSFENSLSGSNFGGAIDRGNPTETFEQTRSI